MELAACRRSARPRAGRGTALPRSRPPRCVRAHPGQRAHLRRSRPAARRADRHDPLAGRREQLVTAIAELDQSVSARSAAPERELPRLVRRPSPMLLTSLRPRPAPVLVTAALLALTASGADGNDDLVLTPEGEPGRDRCAVEGCASCHGSNGEGSVGPALAACTVGPSARRWHTVVADATYLAESIRTPGARRSTDTRSRCRDESVRRRGRVDDHLHPRALGRSDRQGRPRHEPAANAKAVGLADGLLRRLRRRAARADRLPSATRRRRSPG